MSKISVVVPCFNEEKVIRLLFEEVNKIFDNELKGNKLEYIFIDDGSKDGTLSVLRNLSEENRNVKYISFSRNFGKEAAIYAGLENATGDYIAVMDADLQDPPSLLPEMFKSITTQDYDCIATRRVTREGEPPIRSFFAKIFYSLMSKISDIELKDGARDFRLMTRKYVNAVLELKEYNRFSKGLFGWVGFNTKWLEFENVERAAGETKWSFWKLFKYSLDGIVAFSSFPLYLSSFIGVIMCIISFLAIVFIFIRQLVFGVDAAYGWPSLVCIIILIGGLLMLFIGILGLYLSKAYLEIKQRPIYISKEDNIEH